MESNKIEFLTVQLKRAKKDFEVRCIGMWLWCVFGSFGLAITGIYLHDSLPLVVQVLASVIIVAACATWFFNPIWTAALEREYKHLLLQMVNQGNLEAIDAYISVVQIGMNEAENAALTTILRVAVNTGGNVLNRESLDKLIKYVHLLCLDSLSPHLNRSLCEAIMSALCQLGDQTTMDRLVHIADRKPITDRQTLLQQMLSEEISKREHSNITGHDERILLRATATPPNLLVRPAMDNNSLPCDRDTLLRQGVASAHIRSQQHQTKDAP